MQKISVSLHIMVEKSAACYGQTMHNILSFLRWCLWISVCFFTLQDIGDVKKDTIVGPSLMNGLLQCFQYSFTVSIASQCMPEATNSSISFSISLHVIFFVAQKVASILYPIIQAYVTLFNINQIIRTSVIHTHIFPSCNIGWTLYQSWRRLHCLNIACSELCQC